MLQALLKYISIAAVSISVHFIHNSNRSLSLSLSRDIYFAYRLCLVLLHGNTSVLGGRYSVSTVDEDCEPNFATDPEIRRIITT